MSGAAMVWGGARYLLLTYNSRGELYMARLYKTLKWAKRRATEHDAIYDDREYSKVIEVAALRTLKGDGVSALNDEDAEYLRSMGIAV